MATNEWWMLVLMQALEWVRMLHAAASARGRLHVVQRLREIPVSMHGVHSDVNGRRRRNAQIRASANSAEVWEPCGRQRTTTTVVRHTIDGTAQCLREMESPRGTVGGEHRASRLATVNASCEMMRGEDARRFEA